MSATVCLFAWLGAIASSQLSPAEEADRLSELWGKQRKEIQTAAITADHFVYYPTRMHRGVLEAFLADLQRQVANGIDKVDGPTLSAGLPPDINRRHDWQRLSLVQDGARCRAESHWQTPDGQPRVTVLAFDGVTEVHWRDAIGQASLFRGRTAMAIPDVSAFRMVPCFPANATPDREGTQLRLTGNDWVMFIETETGLLRHAALGETIVMQYGTWRLPGDIAFPRLVVRARFNGPNLNKLEVLKILSAKLNQPLAAEAFQVSLPAGATIVDGRTAPLQPDVYRLTQATRNAAALVAKGNNVNRGCQPQHEIFSTDGIVTPCRIEGGRCGVHDNRNARGQLKWFDATCTDPICRLRHYTSSDAQAGRDLWINEYKLACYVRTTDTGLTCERTIEYVPCYVNRPGSMVCMPSE